MKDGRSALDFAAKQGDEATVQLLIETGGEELRFRTEIHGRSALQTASLSGQVEVVRLLIGAGGQRLLFLTDKFG